MSGAAVDVAVRIGLKDSATPGIDKFAERANQAAQKTAETVEKSNARQRTSYERTSQAREVLGVRSEQRIQREITQTEAAYKRLTDAGKLSAQEQARALDATTRKVTQLTNEMGKLTAAQEKSARSAEQQARGAKALQVGGAVVAGVVAGKYALQAPVKEAMSYDRRLAHTANTTYGERDEAGRIIGMKTLEGAVNSARKYGGGTREQGEEALNTIIASGVVSDRDAMTMLPGIMKASTASGADANALAQIAVRAKQTFGIDPKDFEQVLSAAMKAGQLGGFELKDMAKWLPQQMAMGKQLGMNGKDDLLKLMAWNQSAVITSGTKDEAGTNLKDLLMEVNTEHFKARMAKEFLGGGHHLKRGEKESKIKTVNDVYLDYQSRGVDPVSATMDMMDKMMSKNKKYQELQAKLKTLGKDDNAEKAKTLEAMSAQVKGTQVGRLFGNQQSMLGFVGLAGNRAYGEEVLNGARGQLALPTDKSEVTTSYKVQAATADFKVEQAGEDTKLAKKAALDELTPAIGRAAEAFGNLVSKYPALMGGTILATTGLTAVAGAAGLAALTLGGGKGAAITNAAGRAAGLLGTAARFAGPAGLAAGAGYAAGSVLSWGIDKVVQAGTGNKDQTLGTWIYDMLHKDSPLVESLKNKDVAPPPVPVNPAEVNAKFTIGLAPELVMYSQSMKATGMNVRTDTGNIWNGTM